MTKIKEARIESTPASIGTSHRVNKEVSQSQGKKVGIGITSHLQCPHYKGRCIIPDLCRQRQIEYCPLRTRWCQEINETDDQFFEFCLNHPIEGRIPA